MGVLTSEEDFKSTRIYTSELRKKTKKAGSGGFGVSVVLSLFFKIFPEEEEGF